MKYTLLDFMETTRKESLENLDRHEELTKSFVSYLIKKKFNRIIRYFDTCKSIKCSKVA